MLKVLCLALLGGAIAYEADVLCQRKDAVLNGTVSLENALAGLTLNATMVDYQSPLCSYDAASDTWSGFLPQVLQAASQRGGFSWNMKYTTGPTTSNQT